MSNLRTIHLLGYASDLAAANIGAARGPEVVKDSSFLAGLKKKTSLIWEDMLVPEKVHGPSKLATISKLCQHLAVQTESLSRQKKFFTVLGGDHSSAIGTWSGVAHAIKDRGDLGLIWIDAHMDSHTPHTSLTGNIHGMPLASLLGYGMPSLTHILESEPKLKPENICLIGVRSFERGEAALLKELNVRIFFMEEVKERGLKAVVQEAVKIITQNTAGFGLSIDIDSLDPEDAPGTGVAEPNGIRAKDLLSALEMIGDQPDLIGAEIVEFDPSRDKNHKTEKLIVCMLAILALGKGYHAAFENCCAYTTDAVV